MSDLAATGRVSHDRAWFVFAGGVVAYGVAVFERTTLGVAGPEAARHFGAPAGVIATFVVVQLLVYTVMQIPAGILLDRFGARRMIGVGLVLMAVGQVLLAFADSVSAAIPARIVVGGGDAFIFGSVVRLVPSWFADRQVPFITQLLSQLGQVGQVASALPFAWLLSAQGWRPALLAAAAVAALAAILAVAVLRDNPLGTLATPPARDLARIRRAVIMSWRHPGTRLGMWSHWSCCFATMVFAMFWGFPFLTEGEGRSPRTASLLLALLVVTAALCAPVLGTLVGRHPMRRSNLVLAMSGASLVPWTLVLLWPGPAPLWLLIVLCIGLALGGPGSAIGFDFARTSSHPARLGTATAIVNLGGFTAALIAIQVIGVVLDHRAQGQAYDLADYRVAMATQLPFYLIGIAGIYVTRTKARRRLARRGVVIPPWREALRREWHARQSRRLARLSPGESGHDAPGQGGTRL